MKLKKHHHLLGLGIHGEQVCFVEITRSGDRLHVRRVIHKTLPFAPLEATPALAGAELRKTLDEAGVRVRHCVINLPLAWILTSQSLLPDLPEDDLDSYLALQAEHEFPYPTEEIYRQTSRFQDTEGNQYATTLAFPRQRIESLLEIVHQARLKPLSLTLGVNQFLDNGRTNDAITLSTGRDHLEMAITTGGRLAGLRSLDTLIEREEESEPVLDTQAMVRQVRLTLAQLPDVIRARIRSLNIFGSTEIAGQLAVDLKDQAQTLGLEMTTQSKLAISYELAGQQPEPDPAVLGSAASYLLQGHSHFEFMPERVNKFRLFVRRVSARSTLWVSGVALGIILLTAVAFGWQAHRLGHLETQWAAIEPQATHVETLMDLVRTNRPWFDDTVPSLSLLKQLAKAFPERGDVWVRSVDVKDMNRVTCAGFARSDREWLALHDRLLANPGVTNLEVQQVRGDDPLQFNFTYEWNEVPGNGL